MKTPAARWGSRWMIGMLMVLALAMPVAAEELSQFGAFDTGAYACNTGARDLWLKNPVGKDIRIKHTETWMGMSEHGVADYASHLFSYDATTGKLQQLQIVGWDHYAEPTMPAGIRKSLAPDWRTLKAGDYLRLWTMCQGYPNLNGHVIVFVEYTVAP